MNAIARWLVQHPQPPFWCEQAWPSVGDWHTMQPIAELSALERECLLDALLLPTPLRHLIAF